MLPVSASYHVVPGFSFIPLRNFIVTVDNFSIYDFFTNSNFTLSNGLYLQRRCMIHHVLLVANLDVRNV